LNRALEINGRGLTVKLRINCYGESVFTAALAVVVKKKKNVFPLIARSEKP